MKILLVCEYWYGTGGWQYKKYLEQLGCQVEVFDFRKRAEHPLNSNRMLGILTRRLTRRRMNREFIATAQRFQPDVTFLLKAETLFESALKRVKTRFTKLLFQWYPDGPFNIENRNATKDSIASIPLFDIYFIYARSLITPLMEAGAKRVEYLPFCYDPDLLHPPERISDEERMKYQCDVVFAGTWEPEREKWLNHVRDFDLAIWGNMWEHASGSPELLKKWRGQAVYGEEISKLFAVSKIHLNFLREQNRDSHNVRTLEIPGFGGFLLTQRSEEQAKELFLEGKEIECFDSPEELRDKITYYLQHENKRQAIARAGHERAVKEHQAIHRLRKVVNMASELLGTRV